MMWKLQKSVLLALVAFFSGNAIAASADACQVSVEQTSSSSWNQNGQVYTLVNVGIKNTGSSAVEALNLNIPSGAAFDSYWEMVKTDTGYILPQWRDHAGIPAGQSHTWGYIIKSSSQAAISVNKVECDGQIVTPPVESTVRPTERPTQRPPTTAPTERPTQKPTERPTERPTQRPTERPTDAPTRPPTQRPTERPTQRPTDAPTQRPTQRPTDAPTQRPTQRPTNPPTSTPTTRPTTAPTTRPTTAPTTKPTSAPTTRPTNPTNAPGSSGRLCPAGTIWSPAPGTTWQWQLTGSIDQSFDVQMYDIDLFDTSASVISQLHQKGRAVVCYFSTQYEDWRSDAKDFTSNVLGSNLDDWPGERYVDIRSTVVRNIMKGRLDLAVSKGCDAVEPDNVDEYTNSNGLGITAADQISFNSFLAQEAHARGLSIGLKNDLDQVKSLEKYFDWALNEQCNQYGECDMLTPFVTAGKAVFGVEYSGSAGSFCPKLVQKQFSWLLKDLSLGANPTTQCCTYANGGCATKPAYTCKPATATRSVEELEFAEPEQAVEELEFVEPEQVLEEETLVEEVQEVEQAEVQAEAEFSAGSVLYPASAFVAAVAFALFF